MVLERVEDYVRYKISPPAELQDEYNKITKTNLERLTEKRKGIMEDAEEMMISLKKWWNTDFKPKKRYPKVKKRKGVAGVPPPPPPAPSQMDVRNDEEIEEVVVGSSEADEAYETEEQEYVPAPPLERLMVRSTKGKKHNKVKGKITIVGVKSDKEYMKFFEGKNTDKIYKAYLKHRKDYKTTPSYYFDVAQILWKKDKILALKVLSSIADLGLENAELYKLLAYRLKQMEIYI